MSVQNDFIEGIDLSGETSVNGSQLVQLIREAHPKAPVSNEKGRAIFIVSNTAPTTQELTDNPHLARYLLIKPSESYAVIYRCTSTNPSTWAPVTVADSAITTAKILDGAITLAKLYNPNDALKANFYLMVNGSGTGFVISALVVADNSLTVAKLTAGVEQVGKWLKWTNSGAVWTTLEVVSNIADFGLAINKLVKGTTKQMLRTNAAADGLEWFNLALADLPIGGALQVLRTNSGGNGLEFIDAPWGTMKSLSPAQSISAGFSVLAFPHGLAVKPSQVRVVAVMGSTTELGFVAGDELDLKDIRWIAADNDWAAPVNVNGTNVEVVIPDASAVMSCISRSAGVGATMTRSRWSIKAYVAY